MYVERSPLLCLLFVRSKRDLKNGKAAKPLCHFSHHKHYGSYSRVIDSLKMQSIRNSILFHVRLGTSAQRLERGNVFKCVSRLLCASASTNTDQILDRVVGLVKKFDRIDSSKVTETADFQKDLSLDSLDRVELVMAFEEEFSIEIPEEKSDKLTCCADVARYIVSGADQKSG